MLAEYQLLLLSRDLRRFSISCRESFNVGHSVGVAELLRHSDGLVGFECRLLLQVYIELYYIQKAAGS